MNQEYTPYWTWECYLNGMWSKIPKDMESNMLKKAIEFTSNYQQYGAYMNKVMFLWESTMINNLTNKSINRKAFLGHCACFLAINCPEYITRKAWKFLTYDQRNLANNEALKNIKIWELQYKKKLEITKKLGSKDAIKMAYQMSLQLKF